MRNISFLPSVFLHFPFLHPSPLTFPVGYLNKRSQREGLFFHNSNHLSTLAPQPSSNFMAEYLVTTCGFSPEKAAKSSKRISHITSHSKPDSIMHFLKQNNFTAPQVRILISNYSEILLGDVERTMEPNLCAIRETGLFDDRELRELVASNPQALQLASAVPRIKFWRDFLEGDTRSLVVALTRNPGLLCHDVDKGISPMVALLKVYGLSQSSIARVLVRGRGLFRNSASSMEYMLRKVEGFGFPRGSLMFSVGLEAFCGMRSDTLNAKMELFRSFGWSEGELNSAIKKFPFIVRLSEENVRAKISFMVQKTGCTQRYIARYPVMLGFSMEKRLFPRHHVMQMLTLNKLPMKMNAFHQIMSLTEKKFLETVVLPHNDKLPALLSTYIAASAGKIPVEL